MTSPTARTLARLRRLGYAAGVVERFIAGAGEGGRGIRRDLFGCIDLVAVKAGCPVLGVQATTAGHVGARVAKARAVPDLRAWLGAGAMFEVWGWERRPSGWAVKVVRLRAEDLAAVVIEAPPRRRPRSR